MTTLAHGLLIGALFGCCLNDGRPPKLALLPGAPPVAEAAELSERNCLPFDRVTIEEEWFYSYHEARERALLRLRNEAARIGAHAVTFDWHSPQFDRTGGDSQVIVSGTTFS